MRMADVYRTVKPFRKAPIVYVQYNLKVIFFSADRMQRLRRICKYSLFGVWIYVIYRILLDTLDFHVERRLQLYVESELMIAFSQIPKVLYPVISFVAQCDIIINRILVSGGMSFVIVVYVFVNLVSGTLRTAFFF